MTQAVHSINLCAVLQECKKCPCLLAHYIGKAPHMIGLQSIITCTYFVLFVMSCWYGNSLLIATLAKCKAKKFYSTADFWVESGMLSMLPAQTLAQPPHASLGYV